MNEVDKACVFLPNKTDDDVNRVVLYIFGCRKSEGKENAKEPQAATRPSLC